MHELCNTQEIYTHILKLREREKHCILEMPAARAKRNHLISGTLIVHAVM